MTVTSQASNGHFAAEITVHPLADGSFDDYIRFNTENLRSVTADLSGFHGVTWGAISLTQGEHTYSSFTSGSSTERHGEHSGGDSGYFTLHLRGNVNSLTEHNNGEYQVRVSAVPEPQTMAMMLAGLGLLGVVGRRRRNPASPSA